MIEFERTFDQAAADYDRVRPAYVKELYDDIFRYKHISEDSRVLEIGIGSGKATFPILEKKCSLSALEPGNNLADIAFERYRQYGSFSLFRQTLQDFVCPSETFDLIYSATAFHWIPEEFAAGPEHAVMQSGLSFCI